MSDVPATMAAVVLTGHGGPEKLEYRTDIPVPVPRDDEVLIRVAATGVNNTDINTRLGWYSKSVSADTNTTASDDPGGADADDASWSGEPLTFPRIQGGDVYGEIVAVGAKVPAERVGESVMVRPLMRHFVDRRPYECWTYASECDGGFAQFAVAPSSETYSVRSELTPGELGAIPVSVLNESSSPDPVAELGAGSVDVVVDVVGGDGVQGLLTLLRRGGRYAVAGAIGGPLAQLDLRTIYLNDLSLFGCTFQEDEVFENLIGYIDSGRISPLVSQTYPLSEIHRAQEDFVSKRYPGKLVLIPPPSS